MTNAPNERSGSPSAAISPERRIEGLRNLRSGYESTTAAVGFWKELHGEDLIDVYAALVDECDRARNLAKHLFQMIDRETWRATGGDDGQGHYEGDYRAANIEEEIRSWA